MSKTCLSLLLQCSYVSCMVDKVAAWRRRHGVLWERFPCHFNPKDFKQVLRRRRFNEKALLHSLLWPTGFIVLGVVVMLVLLRVAKLNVRGDIYHPEFEERELYLRKSVQQEHNPNNPIRRLPCNHLGRHASLPVSRPKYKGIARKPRSASTQRNWKQTPPLGELPGAQKELD